MYRSILPGLDPELAGSVESHPLSSLEKRVWGLCQGLMGITLKNNSDLD